MSSEPIVQPLGDYPPNDPLLSGTQPTFVATLPVLHLMVRYETNDERILKAAFDSFGGRDRVIHDPTIRPDLVIRLFRHHVDEEPDWQPVRPLIRSHGHLVTYGASRASSIALDTRAGFACGFLSERFIGDTRYFRSEYIASLVYVFAQQNSLDVIHSACLMRNGRTLLVRGHSGAGKSTLAYAALRAGYTLVGEDAVFITPARGTIKDYRPGDELKLSAAPWTLHLLPDCTRFFPEITEETLTERPSGEMKIRIPVADWFPGQTCQVAPPGSTVFLEPGNGHATLERLGPDEAVSRLRKLALPVGRSADEVERMMPELLRFPMYVLTQGAHPLHTIAALDELTNV